MGGGGGVGGGGSKNQLETSMASSKGSCGRFYHPLCLAVCLWDDGTETWKELSLWAVGTSPHQGQMAEHSGALEHLSDRQRRGWLGGWREWYGGGVESGCVTETLSDCWGTTWRSEPGSCMHSFNSLLPRWYVPLRSQAIELFRFEEKARTSH